jgi:hypothetical protein
VDSFQFVKLRSELCRSVLHEVRIRSPDVRRFVARADLAGLEQLRQFRVLLAFHRERLGFRASLLASLIAVLLSSAHDEFLLWLCWICEI